MISTTYRGRPVEYAVHDRKSDTYSLIGADDKCVAELSARAFLMIPNRTNLEVRSGRYRPAGSKDQRSPDRKPGDAGRDASNPWPYSPPPADALTAATIAAASRHMRAMMRQQWLAAPPNLVWASINLVEVPMPPLKREGIVAGEIVGYRCWRIEHGLLRSVYQSDVWRPKEVLEGRELGDWDSRGIHAWKDSGSNEYHDYIRGYLNKRESPGWISLYEASGDTKPAMVTGTVFLWGDVVEHERGYRAEFARVRSLDWLYPDASMMGKEQSALDDLRARYGVPTDRSTT